MGKYHFIAIGGIGMSGLAKYLLENGHTVTGSDIQDSKYITSLRKLGAGVNIGHREENLPDDVEAVIVSTAIRESNPELIKAKRLGIKIYHRSDLLKEIAESAQKSEMKFIGFAGTHGKTTTSTMTAHLLHQSNVGCNAFLGGISKNYETNLLLSEKSEYIVIEADEFDRSFHWLTPFATVITATDADHLDIYGTKEAYLESFNHYTSLIRQGGALIIRKGIELTPRLQEGVSLYTYSREEGDFHAENIRIGNGEIIFDYISPFGNIKDIQLGVPVAINIENGIAAMALAQISGANDEEIKTAMASFKGVDRRFDFKIKNDKVVFLSDYAHHPEEIKQSILSMRALYADKKITGIFQPHLYTRTRDFYKEFAESLSLLDEVILTEIYPARELPIEGVSSRLIYDQLRPGIEKTLCQKEEILDILKQKRIEVLMTLGAGDIENYVQPICKILNKQ